MKYTVAVNDETIKQKIISHVGKGKRKNKQEQKEQDILLLKIIQNKHLHDEKIVSRQQTHKTTIY